jgi:predicted PurR-regulated permease PerM
MLDKLTSRPFDGDATVSAPADATGSFRPPRPRVELQSATLVALLVLAVFYTLYLGRRFFLPIVLAALLSFLLGPVVQGLRRIWIPAPLGAALVVLSLLGILATGVYQLAGPAYAWAEGAPQSLRKVEKRLRDLKRPVLTVNKATEQMERIAKVAGGAETPTFSVQTETLGERVFNNTTSVLLNGAVMFILLFFLLASRDRFASKLVGLLPRSGDRRRAVAILRRIQTEISAYLLTITLINLVVGLAVWGIAFFARLPNPPLWGVCAMAANYIPYLGVIAMITLLSMVGLLTYDSLPQALAAAGGYAALHALESYLITPLVLGRRLTLNPVVLFLSLTFWTWLWGIPGAVLAVPIMVVVKILCDHSQRLAQVGEFLGS